MSFWIAIVLMLLIATGCVSFVAGSNWQRKKQERVREQRRRAKSYSRSEQFANRIRNKLEEIAESLGGSFKVHYSEVRSGVFQAVVYSSSVSSKKVTNPRFQQCDLLHVVVSIDSDGKLMTDVNSPHKLLCYMGQEQDFDDIVAQVKRRMETHLSR